MNIASVRKPGVRKSRKWLTPLAASLATTCLVFGGVVGAGSASAAPRAVAPPTPKTVINFSFDNEWADQMNAATTLHADGLNGTFYVISAWVNQSGFMSLANLQTLASWGDEIGAKTVDNADLPLEPTSVEASREICLGRNVLMNEGFNVTDFAYPFADLNATDETLVKACGLNSGRGVGDIETPGSCNYPDCPYAESIPAADVYDIRTPDDAEVTTSVQTFETVVLNAELHGGGLLDFSFHHICTPGVAGCDPTYTWTPAQFSSFAKFIQTQKALGLVSVKTMQQIVGGATQPQVTPPAPVIPPMGTNMVSNPTLTTADPNVSTLPACWHTAGYGNNTTTGSYSATGGPGGGGSYTLTTTASTDGDSKLVPNFDLGNCAPTTTTGHSYQLSMSYKSNVSTFITVYQRHADGTWSYLTQSPRFAASSSWSTLNWLTPAIPAGVTGLSFGLTIDSVGTLSTGNYSMVDIGTGPPPAAPIGTNILPNPSLETADTAGGAQCWQPAGYGINSPTFSRLTSGAEDGSAAEEIVMTGVVNGDAKLIPTFDNGNCSPTVVPGHAYSVSVWYRSTVPVFITMYSRSSTDGSWGYWTQSPYFAASPNGWTQATFTTPVVAAGVNGASLGMTIDSNGTLDTDNYSMVEN